MRYLTNQIFSKNNRNSVFLALVLIATFLLPSQAFSGEYHGSGHSYSTDKPQINRVRDQNCANLEKLSVGMTKNKTLEIMGSKKIDCVAGMEPVTVPQPFKSETKAWKNREYEILYYYTHVKAKDLKITDDELTPLVFQGEKLIGWGWNFYEETFQSHQSSN